MDLLHGNIKTMYFRLLTAAIGSAMVASVFALVDAMMVGRYHGPVGTAALAVFNPMWTIVYSLGILAGIGASVLFAHLRGMGQERASNEYFTVSVVLGAVLTAAAMALLYFYNEPMFRFFGADDELLALARRYLAFIWCAVPCCVFDNILAAFLRNDGDADLAMKAVLFGGVFNVFGDYFFVFTLDMGIAGAGLATMTGLYATTLLMLTHFFKKKNTLRLVKVTAPLHKAAKIAATGFPTAVSDLSMGIINLLFNRQIMAYLGTDALSVYGIITQVVAFVQCCAYGAGQAAQPILSQNHGARQPERIRRCLKYGLYTCAVLGVMWTAAVFAFPNVFVKLFMAPTEAVLAIAPAILRAYGVSFLLLPFNIFATYYFQAMLKPGVAMVASLGRGAVVSGVLILVLPVVLGPGALWYAMLLTEIIVLLFSAWQMVRLERRA